ncbi:MAG: iron-sulfur cluster assembly scaffold protein [Spirochaetes bacterium]|nr:iron-sulfur cluster assembly scaffold protein [Spirochaetota bacterium]
MGKNTNLSAEFESNLDIWAENSLAGIGIFKDKSSPEDYERWKKTAIEQLREMYSDKTIDLFLMPVNKRTVDNADSCAKVDGSCGDSMEFFLKVSEEVIVDLGFETDGCGPTIASGGMVAEMIKGKKINEIKKLTPNDVLDALGGLPEENEHCASLAVHALKEALEVLKKQKK